MNKFLLICLFSFTLNSLVHANDALRSLTVDGFSPTQAVMQTIASDFGRTNRVGISIRNSGSKAGLECLLKKSCELALYQGDIPAANINDLIHDVLFLDALVMVVTPDVPVSELTKQQIQSVFEGKIKNWKEIGGPDLPLTVWQRRPASGIFDAFARSFNITSPAQQVGSTQEFMNRLKTAKGLVSYSSFAEVSVNNMQTMLKVLKYDGIEPTAANVSSGKYKIPIDVHILMRKESKSDGDIAKLYQFLLSKKDRLQPSGR